MPAGDGAHRLTLGVGGCAQPLASTFTDHVLCAALHRMASPHDSRCALIVAVPGAATRNTARTVPQPEPGIFEHDAPPGVADGADCAVSTLPAGGRNAQ